MKIPKTFRQFGAEWTVRFDDVVIDDSNLGEISHNEKWIRLYSPNSGHVALARSTAEEVFCHEVIHAILRGARADKELSEEQVDVMGRLLHEYLETAKGELKS